MQPFSIPIKGLKAGHNHFEWHADGKFFETFGNSGILGASVEVVLDLNFHGITASASCTLKGTVTVPCDRCLEDLTLPVDTGFEEDYVAEGDEFDFSQDIYDFVMVSLPLQRVHPDGECNEETVKYISK